MELKRSSFVLEEDQITFIPFNFCSSKQDVLYAICLVMHLRRCFALCIRMC